MLPGTLVAALLVIEAQPAPTANWRTLLEGGKQAYTSHDYALSVTRLKAAIEAATAAAVDRDGVIETLRLLATVYRETGDQEQAEHALKEAIDWSTLDSLDLAVNLEQLAAVQRAQEHGEQALVTITRAIGIRQHHPDSPRAELARDLTTSALLLLKTEPETAIVQLQQAIREWDQAAPGDPQVLPAIEALAALDRDRSQYAEAEPLYLRALRLREAVAGPTSAEVIPPLDSLAYVEFGLKKYAEAEPLYRRLLALWELHGGPDHPMTALTLDKIAEFYAAQQRYEDAGKAAAAALAVRTKAHVASLNQAGRLMVMQAQIAKARDHYSTAIEIGDLSEASNEAMDPLLRVYEKILVALKRDREAADVKERIKNALDRKEKQEGRRPPPTPAVP